MENIVSSANPDILARAQAGDIGAFTDIMHQYQSQIVGYLFRLAGDSEIARDLAQETFIQAYQALARTTPDLPLKVWLYRIATNNALRYHRHKALLSFVTFDESRGLQADADISQIASEAVAVQEILLRIPHKLRICLVLHFVDGFKHREIARMLGISEDAVRMRVTRGSEEFRKLYLSLGGDSK
jgi:RNA polymerase sigma-70 factor, ECF subfamily